VIDNISKFLIEQYSSDFATWLLGQPITLTAINPTELNVEPIRADSVMLLRSSEIILHTEFQTVADETMPFRMADYYLRLRRKFPALEIEQVVIYLKPTTSDLVRQTRYQTNAMTHQFRVIRLWEEPVEVFLRTPGLLPYAVLSRAEDKEEVLERVVAQLEQIPDNRERSNIAAATSILAGLELSPETIRRLMRSPVMRESTMYQSILEEGRAEGEVIGLERGRAEGLQQERALLFKLLARKVGTVTPQLQSQLANLSIERLEALGEALLDFESVADLETWLSRQGD
jgi:predicted transposase/invertase (TIGR01784 family)